MAFLLIAAYVLVAAVLYAIYIIFYQYTYWRRRGILCADFIPIIGNNAALFLRNIPFPIHVLNLYKKHPGTPYYGMFDFQMPTLVVKGPELIREVCIKNFDNFTDHYSFVNEEMDLIVGRNLFSLQGHRWREFRSTLTPSFTAVRMKLMFSLIAECSNDFVQYFVEHPEVASNFEAKEAMTRYTNDVIATAAFGLKVNSMTDRNNEFFMQGKSVTTFSPLFFVKLEMLRKFPKLMRALGFTFFPSTADKFFKKAITDTINFRKEKGIVRQDMVHLLMQAMDKKDGIDVTIEDIVGQASIFFLAGFDTSSSFICFILQELAANPDIQKKLHKEIEKILAEDDGKLTYDSLSKMKYLDMVVNETLRKYPPAPFANRLCTKDFNFPPSKDGSPGYLGKKGLFLMIPIFGLHRDPKYFPEPDKFDPERFSDENKSKISPYVYMPFGVGPRQCIGNRFALMEAKIIIVDIVRKFAIKFTEKSQHPVTYAKRIFTTTAKNGYWFKFEERKKIN